MTAEVMKICGAALICAVCAFLLREFGWRGTVAFSLIVLAVLAGVLADKLSELVKTAEVFSEYSGVGDVAKEILKITGVSYIFGISSDICSELGERSLSSILTAVGRIEIMLIAMPYFLKIIRYAAELVL